MFNPRPFKVTDIDKIVSLIRKYSLGLMFSSTNGNNLVSHIPFLVDDNLSTLTGHMARANPQWKGLDGKEVLIVFRGPNHYISPTWYKEDLVVPTWNYVASHITGTLHVESDPEKRVEILDRIVSRFESDIGGSWSADWTEKTFANMMDQIVVFNVAVTQAEGKWKLSQNHPEHAWRSVVSELLSTGSEGKELGKIMQNDPQMYRK